MNMNVWLTLYEGVPDGTPGVQGSQKKALDPLKLE